MSTTPGTPLPTKHKIAEILVVGKQNSVFMEGKGDDIGVAQTSGSLGDVEDIMPGCSQKRDQGRCNTFVSEPAHVQP